MNEQPTGTCKHGTFILAEGCPQCIEERRAADEGAKTIYEMDSESIVEEAAGQEPELQIVKVHYISENTGEIIDREYCYFSEDPLKVGDVVQVPVRGMLWKAVVTAIDVPEAEIESFRDQVKTIPSGSVYPDLEPPPEPEPPQEIETTEVELPTAETPPVAQVASLFDQSPSDHVEAYNCPPNCQFCIPSGGPADNPDIGGCAVEDKIPLEPRYENDPSLPLCPEYQAAYLIEPEPVQEEEVPMPTEQGVPPALVTIETHIGKPTTDLFPLYQEAASLLQVAKKRTITTNEDLKPATDDLAVIAVCKKAMFARKTELVGPLKAKLDLVNQAFNDLMFPILEADRLTRGQVSTFDTEQRRKAAEAKRIEDEKFKLAQDEAALAGTGEHTQELGTAVGPPPVPEHTRTGLGTLGGRTNWKARVVDFKLLPDEYKLPNEPLLNSFARSTKGERPIPGVVFFDDRIPTLRTR